MFFTFTEDNGALAILPIVGHLLKTTFLNFNRGLPFYDHYMDRISVDSFLL